MPSRYEGKLRTLIDELLHDDDDDDEDPNIGTFTCMFLFLHFSSPSAEAAQSEKEMRPKIAECAAKVMVQHFKQSGYQVEPLDPQWMVMAFLHELMKRSIAAVTNGLSIDSTDRKLIINLTDMDFNRVCDARTAGMSSFSSLLNLLRLISWPKKRVFSIQSV